MRKEEANRVSDELRENENRVRVDSLKALFDELGRAANSKEISASAFSKTFAKAKQILELDDSTVAKMIGISRPTIWRWQNGESAPYDLMRPVIFKSLKNEAARKLRAYRGPALAGS